MKYKFPSCDRNEQVKCFKNCLLGLVYLAMRGTWRPRHLASLFAKPLSPPNGDVTFCQVAMSAMWKISPAARPPLTGPKVAK